MIVDFSNLFPAISLESDLESAQQQADNETAIVNIEPNAIEESSAAVDEIDHQPQTTEESIELSVEKSSSDTAKDEQHDIDKQDDEAITLQKSENDDLSAELSPNEKDSHSTAKDHEIPDHICGDETEHRDDQQLQDTRENIEQIDNENASADTPQTDSELESQNDVQPKEKKTIKFIECDKCGLHIERKKIARSSQNVEEDFDSSFIEMVEQSANIPMDIHEKEDGISVSVKGENDIRSNVEKGESADRVMDESENEPINHEEEKEIPLEETCGDDAVVNPIEDNLSAESALESEVKMIGSEYSTSQTEDNVDSANVDANDESNVGSVKREKKKQTKPKKKPKDTVTKPLKRSSEKKKKSSSASDSSSGEPSNKRSNAQSQSNMKSPKRKSIKSQKASAAEAAIVKSVQKVPRKINLPSGKVVKPVLKSQNLLSLKEKKAKIISKEAQEIVKARKMATNGKIKIQLKTKLKQPALKKTTKSDAGDASQMEIVLYDPNKANDKKSFESGYKSKFDYGCGALKNSNRCSRQPNVYLLQKMTRKPILCFCYCSYAKGTDGVTYHTLCHCCGSPTNF